MKIQIKTAHGYLSFQPDGRIEYRPTAGAWEELEVDGLDLPNVPPLPVPPLPVPPLPPEPPPDDLVASPTAYYVARVKERLVAQGVNLAGPCGAFSITKRVAWGLRHLGYGLVSKPSGNNCEGYSTDYLCLQNGDGVDILVDGGNRNEPTWQTKPGEFAGTTRWRAPVQP